MESQTYKAYKNQCHQLQKIGKLTRTKQQLAMYMFLSMAELQPFLSLKK